MIDVGGGYLDIPAVETAGFKMIDVLSSLSQYLWVMDSVLNLRQGVILCKSIIYLRDTPSVFYQFILPNYL